MSDQLPIINFSFNWNGKLFCKCIPTIRVRNDHKYQVGRKFELQLQGRKFAEANLRCISHFTIDKLNDSIAALDTALSLEDCKKLILTMYKNKNFNWDTQQFSFIILHCTERQMIPLPEELYLDTETVKQ